MKTDKATYRSGDYVVVSGIVKIVDGTVNGDIPRIAVENQSVPGAFILIDNIRNIDDMGYFTYTFQLKGIGTQHSGEYVVYLFSSDGSRVETKFDYRYDRELALTSNPMSVDWSDESTVYYVLNIHEANQEPVNSESEEVNNLPSSRQIRLMAQPDDSATIREMSAGHLKMANNVITQASLDIHLDAHANGTLILDIPVDVVKPDPLLIRGLGAKTLDGAAPFEITSNAGNPTSRLLYHNEVEHIIAIDYTPDYERILVLGQTAEPISDPTLLDAYAVNEFEYAAIVVAISTASIIVMSRAKLGIAQRGDSM